MFDSHLSVLPYHGGRGGEGWTDTWMLLRRYLGNIGRVGMTPTKKRRKKTIGYALNVEKKVFLLSVFFILLPKKKRMVIVAVCS